MDGNELKLVLGRIESLEVAVRDGFALLDCKEHIERIAKLEQAAVNGVTYDVKYMAKEQITWRKVAVVMAVIGIIVPTICFALGKWL
jgi:hypothetical protein